MGYTAQVQESPNQQNFPTQTSGKGGPVGQLYDQINRNAPRAPDQQNPVGMSQADQGGYDSGAPHQTMGKGGNYSMSATSGQPRVGQPNAYPNTVGMGDNTQQQPNQAQAKGKGA